MASRLTSTARGCVRVAAQVQGLGCLLFLGSLRSLSLTRTTRLQCDSDSARTSALLGGAAKERAKANVAKRRWMAAATTPSGASVGLLACASTTVCETARRNCSTTLVSTQLRRCGFRPGTNGAETAAGEERA